MRLNKTGLHELPQTERVNSIRLVSGVTELVDWRGI